MASRSAVTVAPDGSHCETNASGGGSSGRVAAGVVRVGNTMSAAVADTRILEPVEAHIALIAAAILAGLAGLAFAYPRGIAYSAAVAGAWLAAAMLSRSIELYRRRRRHRGARPTEMGAPNPAPPVPIARTLRPPSFPASDPPSTTQDPDTPVGVSDGERQPKGHA